MVRDGYNAHTHAQHSLPDKGDGALKGDLPNVKLSYPQQRGWALKGDMPNVKTPFLVMSKLTGIHGVLRQSLEYSLSDIVLLLGLR